MMHGQQNVKCIMFSNKCLILFEGSCYFELSNQRTVCWCDFFRNNKMYVQLTLRCFRATIFAVDKSIRIIYSEIVFYPYVSSMQCSWAKFLPVACPAVPYFSTLSHKRQVFSKYKIYILSFSLKLWKVSRTKEHWARYVIKLVPVFM